MEKKFNFIKNYEADCLQAPANIGGEAFTSKTGHFGAWGSVQELVHSCGLAYCRAKEDGKKSELYYPGVYGFDFWDTEKDVLAYMAFQSENQVLFEKRDKSWINDGLQAHFQKLLDTVGTKQAVETIREMEIGTDYQICNQKLFDNFQDFAINYLNIAKIGTHDIHDKSGGKTIVTSDPTPHIRFERWIKDGFHIHQVNSLVDFDVEKNEFVSVEPTILQINADRNKCDELAEFLGKEIPFDSKPLLSHSRFGNTNALKIQTQKFESAI